MSSLSSLPALKPCRRVIESSGPCHQIFHASCRQQRAFRIQAVYSDIFWIGDHSLLSKRRSFGRNGLQTDRAHSCHRRESAAALLPPFGLVEIRDALFSYDVADVISIDHDGRDWHSGLSANLYRVKCLNERGNTAFLKGFDGLNHELSAANDWRALC